ncbi:MAG: type III-B CRISPR-associated protein Cas10/Cmr2 [Planktothrix sp.]
MNLYYHRKLYALLYQLGLLPGGRGCVAVDCLRPYAEELEVWWHNQGTLIENLSKASDRVTLDHLAITLPGSQVSHLISGQWQNVGREPGLSPELITHLNLVAESNARKAFWWLWRFYPEFLLAGQTDALLFPADRFIPDCPKHSYYSTVSAIAGAIPPNGEETDPDKHPYLLLFTFSPVQEFIKSSRKFLDFWAGSYLLHYLSARLCWSIARIYGPDSVITPSLWSQEIIDAMLVKFYPNFAETFHTVGDTRTPVQRFEQQTSTSLSTAGFPNVITAIVPGKLAAEKLGKQLSQHLTTLWCRIAYQVRDEIRSSTLAYLNDSRHQEKLEELVKEFAQSEKLSKNPDNPNRQDLEKWKTQSCWEWNKLWQAQTYYTWEPYWTAVPLGNPTKPLFIESPQLSPFDAEWIKAQEEIAPSRHQQPTPTDAENLAYEKLNVGTWWANVQSRLGQGIQAFKNTRLWQIPAAPGERSTLSGQFSALHPSLNYGIRELQSGHIVDYREGAGVSSGSMQLFWQLMVLVYPGLFNGSEKLNALELTKRMAWVYGGVAKSLGIHLEGELCKASYKRDYEKFVRFPNLSSIAAGRFAADHPELVRSYWRNLAYSITQTQEFGNTEKKEFFVKTLRRFQVPKTDAAIDLQIKKRYNGVMFSSKWLADDMGLNKNPSDSSNNRLTKLRGLVTKAHKDCGFGDSSPSDWWAIAVADGDDMGKYVSGTKLNPYRDYIDRDYIDTDTIRERLPEFDQLLETRKRMGPATHIGLNRALLDFSNRIVPYLTEKRFCGKVVYSGGDDVLAVLPLADLPGFLRSLRAAWCGGEDPDNEFQSRGGYWHPHPNLVGLPNRPLFTMGEGATMSVGIVVAHKSVPLPTVLEYLWSAEKERAKEMKGAYISRDGTFKKIPPKDGLCFRVIYGSGNVLEASMKGHLLKKWWEFIESKVPPDKLSPVLYRLAEQLPLHSCLTQSDRLISKAAQVIVNSRDEPLPKNTQDTLNLWLNAWEEWAYAVDTQWQKELNYKSNQPQPIGCSLQDLAKLLRFTAFWLDKMAQQNTWR